MLKRLFWLALAGVAGWLAWQWLRQREAELTRATPHFAPPRPIARPIPPPAPAQPETSTLESVDADLERVAGAAEGAAPEAAESESAAPAEEHTGDSSAPPAGLAAAATTTASENERAAIEDAGAASAETQPIEREVIGYCVRCKTKRPIQGAHEETTETGRHAARGTCPVCGANMFTFLKDNEPTAA